MIWVIIALLVGFGGGWFLKGKFGVKAAADVNAVQAAVQDVKKAV